MPVSEKVVVLGFPKHVVKRVIDEPSLNHEQRCPGHGQPDNRVSNREKEIAEEVEKYALYCQKESAEQLGRENVMLAYDMDSRQVAAKKILQILKH